MINIKYYLTLLISVFLSLGIGIVIGISLQSKDVLEKQHSIIAQRLEEEFVGIRDENRQLRKAVVSLEESERSNRELSDSLFNALAKNKLDGLRVSLIELGNDKDFSDLIGLLKISGASIESSMTFDSGLFQGRGEPNAIIDVLSTLELGQNEFYDELAANLMDSLSLGEETRFLERLKELNLIHSSIDIQDSCDAVVLAYAGTNSDRKDIERFYDNFVRLSSDYSTPIILVQNHNADLLNLGKYRKSGVSTVDHMDTLYGKLSLVSLLYGSTGNYGYGEGCQGVLPEEIFPIKHKYSIDTETYMEEAVTAE